MRAPALAALTALALAAPALDPASGTAFAHDLPHADVPDGPVVVLEPLWPELGRVGGQGHVRLVYHSPDLAARLGVDELWRYEQAYDRHLARRMRHLPLSRAEPAARHDAWHTVVGGRGAAVGTTHAVPHR